MKHWMFSCKDVSQKISQSMDVQQPLRHRMAVRIHLMMCRYCARFYRQLVMLREMSRHTVGDPIHTQGPKRLSRETKEQIKETLRSVT